MKSFLLIATILFPSLLFAQMPSMQVPKGDSKSKKQVFSTSKQIKHRDGTVKSRSANVSMRSTGMSPEDELQIYVYTGNFRKVQALLKQGVDLNKASYPSCGPKGSGVHLAVNSGSALMTRLVIQYKGDTEYKLHSGYLNPSWGWVPENVESLAREMGRDDLVSYIQNKRGLKGTIRNVTNLQNYFEFKPYTGKEKIVEGRWYMDEITKTVKHDGICRYTTNDGTGFSYGVLTEDSETGNTICDLRYWKNSKHSLFENQKFEVLVHKVPLKSNQEIVWEAPLLKGSNAEVLRYSYQPPDDKKQVMAICHVADGYTVSGLNLDWTKACGILKNEYADYNYYHSFLTLVELVGE